jgi:hypothetical protein
LRRPKLLKIENKSWPGTDIEGVKTPGKKSAALVNEIYFYPAKHDKMKNLAAWPHLYDNKVWDQSRATRFWLQPKWSGTNCVRRIEERSIAKS